MESLEKLHEIELEAFKEFKKICEENGLSYYAIGGTLLGAGRHKGFIPWDDDIDVGMPRADYNKFVRIARKKLSKDYIIEDYHYTKGFKSYFCKIRSARYDVYEALTDNENDKRIGYLIDIIPIDGTPNSPMKRCIYYSHVMWLRFLAGTANVYSGIKTSRPKWEQILLFIMRKLKIYRLIDVYDVYERMDRLFNKQDCMKSKY